MHLSEINTVEYIPMYFRSYDSGVQVERVMGHGPKEGLQVVTL